MTETSKLPPPENDTSSAGRLLTGFIEHQLKLGMVSDDLTRRVCHKAQELAAIDLDQCKTESEKIKVLAVKSAAEALTESTNGINPEGSLLSFQSLVENLEGGKREIDLGGKKITNKNTVRENWQRAAAIILWKNLPAERDTLAADAKKILGIKNKKALAKFVDNFDQKYDPDNPSPVGIHYCAVTEFFEETGWNSLKDY